MKKNKKLFFLFSIIIGVIALSMLMTGHDDIGGTMLAFNAAPLLIEAGKVDLPGMRKAVVFIPEAFCTKIPAIPAIESGGNLSCVATGSFAFATGKKPIYIDCSKRKVGYDFEAQGENGSKSWLQKSEFFHPGSKKEAAAFAAQVINTPGYLILEDANGDQIMMGSKGLPAEITCSGSLGKAPTDAKGFSFSAEADSCYPIVYLGTPVDFEEIRSGTTTEDQV